MEAKTASFFIFITLVSDDWLGGALCSFSSADAPPQIVVSSQKDVDQKRGLFSVFDELFEECLEKAEKKKQDIAGLVFVVSPFWTTAEGLIPSKAQILKQICQKYNFSLGKFLIDDEALSDYYSSEGAPANFISLFVGRENFRLSLVYLGKIRGRVKQKVQGKITAYQVKEALSRLDFEGVLPPQIVVWGRLPPSFSQSLVEYPWTEEEGLFLHLPDVKDLGLEAAIEAFATVIQKRLISGELKLDKPLLTQEAAQEVKGRSEKEESERLLPKKGAGEERTREGLPEGFSRQDVAEAVKEEKTEERMESEKKPEVSFEEDEGEEDWRQDDLDQKKKVVGQSQKLGKLVSLKERIFLTLFSFRNIPNRFVKTRFFSFRLTFGILLFLIALSGLFFWVYKVKVLLFVTPQLIQKRLSATLKKDAVFDPQSGIIPVKEISTAVEVAGREASTGEKRVGERAKGRVAVYNRTASPKSFTQGTVIIGPDDLQFIFKEEVKIASKTADLVSGADRWGKAEVEVEAADIGSRYNLAKDTVFKIKGESSDDFLVKSVEDFSGGTSRSLTAVDSQDIVRLRDSLLEQAREIGEKQIKGLISESDQLISDEVSVEVSEFTTSNKVGDEVDSIEGKLIAKISALTFSKENLKKLAKEVLNSEKKSGLVLDPESFKFEFEISSEDKKETKKIKLRVEGKAYPSVDKEKIKRILKGKSKNQVGEVVKSIHRVYRYQLAVYPGWLRFFPRMPFNTRNIILEIREE